VVSCLASIRTGGDARRSTIFHQGPGFTIFFQAHLLGFAMRVEAEHGGEHAGFDGEDVPEVERDDVGDQEVDVLGAIDAAAFADGVSGAGFVGLRAEAIAGFDLDADKAVSVVEDEVVALAVAPRLGDAESELAGFVKESGFTAFSAALGVL
jgi:hypothetical protein